MKKWGLSVQLLHYALVGMLSNMTGYVVYLLITYLGGSPKLTMSLLYGVGATIGYWGNRKLTFAYEGGGFGTTVKYLLVHSFGYFLNLTLLIVMVDILGYDHQWVQGVAIFIVAFFLFLAFKFFVFKEVNLLNGGANETLPRL